MSVSSKITVPNVKIQSGIMKNAEKVEMAVMVMDRFKLPPNIRVQMFEAPPPGETPVTKRPSLMADSEAGKMNPRPNERRGMMTNWQMNPMAGPIGLLITSLTIYGSKR